MSVYAAAAAAGMHARPTDERIHGNISPIVPGKCVFGAHMRKHPRRIHLF